MPIKLTQNGYYAAKDQLKADQANKYIGKGSIGSSTHQYMLDAGEAANCDTYVSTDRVFISINGKRPNRVGIEKIRYSIIEAADAGVVFITDTLSNRLRPFNVGEREVANLLLSLGYKFRDGREYGTWAKI